MGTQGRASAKCDGDTPPCRDELYKDLPAAGDDKRTYWKCSPNDEDDYVSFVEYVLRRASLTDPDEAKSAPFQIGLRDGLDVRATLRNWTKGKIYVREEQRGRLNFRNGVIDWINASEHSDSLTGKLPDGGWIDPDLTRLGSCSREKQSPGYSCVMGRPNACFSGLSRTSFSLI